VMYVPPNQKLLLWQYPHEFKTLLTGFIGIVVPNRYQYSSLLLSSKSSTQYIEHSVIVVIINCFIWMINKAMDIIFLL